MDGIRKVFGTLVNLGAPPPAPPTLASLAAQVQSDDGSSVLTVHDARLRGKMDTKHGSALSLDPGKQAAAIAMAKRSLDAELGGETNTPLRDRMVELATTPVFANGKEVGRVLTAGGLRALEVLRAAEATLKSMHLDDAQRLRVYQQEDVIGAITALKNAPAGEARGESKATLNAIGKAGIVQSLTRVAFAADRPEDGAPTRFHTVATGMIDRLTPSAPGQEGAAAPAAKPAESLR